MQEIKGNEPLEEQWAVFGWGVIPVASIASTVKGKGVSFTENNFKYHNCSLTGQEHRAAERETLDQIRPRKHVESES